MSEGGAAQRGPYPGKPLWGRVMVALEGAPVAYGFCSEVCAEGLSLQLDAAAHVGQLGVAVFELPLDGELEVLTLAFHVAHSAVCGHAHQLAIEFYGVDPAQRALLWKFLR